MRSSSRASTNEAEESISYAPQDASLEQQSERNSWEGTWGSGRRAPASFQRLLMQTFVLGRCLGGHLTSGLTFGRRRVAHTRDLLAADGCMDSLSSHGGCNGGCNAAGDMVALFSCGLGDRLKTHGEERGCEGELPDHQLDGTHQADRLETGEPRASKPDS